MPSRIKLQCADCGFEFYRQPSQIRTKNAFCNRECYFSYQRKYPSGGKLTPQEYRICLVCPNTFKTSRKRNQQHCSKKCKISATKIEVVCQNCGIIFTSNQSRNQKDCSNSCRYPNTKKTNCGRCGVLFTIHSNKKNYCSEICRRPVFKIKCLNCDKDFRIQPYYKNSRRFCSTRCYRKFTGETEPEKNVRLILEKRNITFLQEYKVDGWRYPVDFYLTDLNLMLEVDEPYWHNKTKDRDARKTALLESKGYKVVRISATPFYGQIRTDTEMFLVENLTKI